jgi:hypothetical protein
VDEDRTVAFMARPRTLANLAWDITVDSQAAHGRADGGTRRAFPWKTTPPDGEHTTCSMSGISDLESCVTNSLGSPGRDALLGWCVVETFACWTD